MKNEVYDLVGIGLGPFNLSLACLLHPLKNIKTNFLDAQSSFSWHEELLFSDAVMQTNFLKDLVSAIDPKSEFSFLNYLVEKGLFYQFLNTNRSAITRFEFQDYCRWAASKLDSNINYSSFVEGVEHKENCFKIYTKTNEFFAKNICLGTGPVKKVPACVKDKLSSRIFHAKSEHLKNVQMEGKRVLVVGGGQTGLEIFRNSLQEKWGRASQLTIVSDRQTFQPLDEAPFSNDFFTPKFINDFFEVDQEVKDKVVDSQKFMSDGNTPDYLVDFYRELYLDKFYTKKFTDYKILPMRWLQDVNTVDSFYRCEFKNLMYNKIEENDYDLIILATGFETKLPECFKEIVQILQFDEMDRPILNFDYSLKSTLSHNKIFAMNFSRHCHGIADPQTSLMAYRSASIVNSIVEREYYKLNQSTELFCQYK